MSRYSLVIALLCFQNPNYPEGPGFFPNDLSVLVTDGVPMGENISPAMIPPIEHPGGLGWITGFGDVCGKECGV